LAEVLDRAEAARATAQSFLKLDDAPMTIGVMCTIGPIRFVNFLNDFRAANPGIEITMLEAVPGRLSDLLLEGKVDIAVMAQPQPFDDRLHAQALYRERFVVAFPIGHAFERKNAIAIHDMDGQIYLSRINCEYRDHLSDLCKEHGVKLNRSYRSEREDWIQTLVASGLGVCFMPEYSAVVPGLLARPVVEPEVEREVSLVTVAGRRHSQPVGAFVRAARAYPWLQSSTLDSPGA
jgi:DNA-binding transcriptional LysR family regulator